MVNGNPRFNITVPNHFVSFLIQKFGLALLMT